MSEITRKVIEERLSGMKERYQQAMNDANALYGAVQNCEWFLAKLDEKAEEPAEVANVS